MKFLANYAFLLSLSVGSAFIRRGLVNEQAGYFSRISNGLPAAPSEFRYQVGLRIWFGSVRIICGGSLISDEWVLTAAHCTNTADTIVVHLGSIRFEEAPYKIQVYPTDIIQHHDFNRTTHEHDIAVIRMPIRSVRLSDFIRTVNLPHHQGNLPQHQDTLPSYAGLDCVLAGWGHTSDAVKRNSPTLQYAIFKIMPNEDCASIFGPAHIYKGKLCTRTPHKTSGCKGDSGGPLVLLRRNFQIGIFSFGSSRGCEFGVPNAYTRVDYYLDWIRRHTGLGG